MAAHPKLDRRRVDLCAVEFRKRASPRRLQGLRHYEHLLRKRIHRLAHFLRH